MPLQVLCLEDMRAEAKMLAELPSEVRGHRINEMHFRIADDFECLFRQAALDAIEITEKDAEIRALQGRINALEHRTWECDW